MQVKNIFHIDEMVMLMQFLLFSLFDCTVFCVVQFSLKIDNFFFHITVSCWLFHISLSPHYFNIWRFGSIYLISLHALRIVSFNCAYLHSHFCSCTQRWTLLSSQPSICRWCQFRKSGKKAMRKKVR